MIRRVGMALVFVAVSAGTLMAQGRNGSGRGCSWGNFDRDGYWIPSAWTGNVPYTGKFTWVRLAYIGAFLCQPEGPGWAHDFPRSDKHFMKILDAVSNVKPHFDSTNVFRMDDPDFTKYTVAYLSEANGGAGWDPSPKEVIALRAWMRKGGFLVVDDFKTTFWWNFVATMKQILPEAQIMKIPNEHPVFDSFFRIDADRIASDIQQYAVNARYGLPEFHGIFENNDPKGRLMMVVNYQADVGEFMEFADEGYAPVDINNEVFKLMVNYVVYALTR